MTRLWDTDRTWIEHSRTEWTSKANIENVRNGCLQRIATATEAMAVQHTELMRQRDQYQRGWEEREENVRRLRLSNAALRGVITKMKKEAQHG